MFDLVQRIHTLIDSKGETKLVETVSVHDLASKSKRVGNAEALIQDAKNVLKSKSESVVARIGHDGGIFKLAVFLDAGYVPQPTTYTVLGNYPSREAAETARADYLIANAGKDGLVGSASFTFIRNGNGGGGNTFHQPISGSTAKAVDRITDVLARIGLTLDLSPAAGVRFNNGYEGGVPFQTLSNIVLYCALTNKDYDPTHTAVVNGVTFEQGEFKSYGQLYRKLVQAKLVY